MVTVVLYRLLIAVYRNCVSSRGWQTSFLTQRSHSTVYGLPPSQIAYLSITMISNPRHRMVLLPETSANAIYDRIPKWGDWIKCGIALFESEVFQQTATSWLYFVLSSSKDL